MGTPHQRKPRAPLHLGRYEILVPLASGGMGTVYIGAVRGAGGFEREVAVKLIHEHLREEEQFTEDLLEEAKLAVRIRHPNVVGVLDVGEEAEGVYLVMDYVEGDSLAGLMRRLRELKRAMPAVVGLRILHDALLGLHAAHELRNDGELIGLVHRDFTPQNIIVGIDGIARLTDFGVAKAATRSSHTATGIVKGKLNYMPPEQAKAEPIDRKADIWSAGVIAWELLARRRLYSDLNDAAIVLQLVSSSPPPLRTVNPQIPEALEGVVARALCPADQRYPTAEAFARALEDAAGELGGLADRGRVATFVQSCIEEQLQKRREQIEKVRSLRDSLHSLTDIPPEQQALSTPSDFGPAKSWSGEGAAPAHELDTGGTQIPMSLTPAHAPQQAPDRGGSRRLLVAALAALVVGGGAAFWLTDTRPGGSASSPPRGVAAVEGEPSPPVAAPHEPKAASTSASGDEKKAPDEPPAPSARKVSLRSALVIAKVMAGDQELPIEPGREITIEVAPDVDAVIAISAVGTRRRVPVGDGVDEADVRFPAGRPTPPPTKVQPPPPPADGLAPNPFDE